MSIHQSQLFSKRAEGAPSSLTPGSKLRFVLDNQTKIDLSSIQIWFECSVTANTLTLSERAGTASLIDYIDLKINGKSVERYDSQSFARLTANYIQMTGNTEARAFSGQMTQYAINTALTTSKVWYRLPLFVLGLLRKRLKLDFSGSNMSESIQIEIGLNNNTDSLTHASNTDNFLISDTLISFRVPSSFDEDLISVVGKNIVFKRFHTKQVPNSTVISESIGLTCSNATKIGCMSNVKFDTITSANKAISDLSKTTKLDCKLSNTTFPQDSPGSNRGVADIFVLSQEAWSSGYNNQVSDRMPTLSQFTTSTYGYGWIDLTAYKNKSGSKFNKRYALTGTKISNSDVLRCNQSSVTASTSFLIIVELLSQVYIDSVGSVQVSDILSIRDKRISPSNM